MSVRLLCLVFTLLLLLLSSSSSSSRFLAACSCVCPGGGSFSVGELPVLLLLLCDGVSSVQLSVLVLIKNVMSLNNNNKKKSLVHVCIS